MLRESYHHSYLHYIVTSEVSPEQEERGLLWLEASSSPIM